ncbi:MAG: Ig-like domain-containing protein, partial [Oscillospiraceae bacterium]|nr:Ig-like domain-containing protein [Oscillospiraceae bacterium]
AVVSQIAVYNRILSAAEIGELTAKADLEAAIAKYESLTMNNYTFASWTAAQSAYGAAIVVDANAAATQAEVRQAAVALWAALDALKGLEFDRGSQPASVTIRKGMKYQINIQSNNPDTLFYISSNANATVDANGLVTAVKTGSAVITVIDSWAQQYFTVTINITS